MENRVLSVVLIPNVGVTSSLGIATGSIIGDCYDE
jgi:hypothetical protein